MKKIIALCSALLLAAAFTGCGNSQKDNSTAVSSDSNKGSSESSSVEQSDEEEKVVVDPFDKVAYGIPKEDDIGRLNVYPDDFIIQMDASESPFGSHMTFTYFIESADENEIIIKARANVDEIQDFLDEYNYAVEETEKTFSIKVADLTTNLISADLISGENKTKIVDLMQEHIESELKMSEDDEYEDPLAALGINSNNPDYKEQIEKEKEEFEKEKAESLQKEFNLEKLYVILPLEIQYKLVSRKETSSITSRMNEDSFEDEMIYTNRAQLEISSDFNNKCIIMGIFKDTTDNYYCVKTSNYTELVFNKGSFEEESIDCNLLTHPVENEYGVPHNYYEYDDENSAYEDGLSLINKNECQIVEVTLS